VDIFTLRQQQEQGSYDLRTTLRSVVINPVERCNRTCIICPRSDELLYPTLNTEVSLEVVTKIANDLEAINFEGRVGFDGLGEPLLHSNLVECVSIVRKTITRIKWLEVQTNGDYLTRDKIKELINAGCDTISISMYDKDDTEKFQTLAKNLPVSLILRHHYDKSVNYNLHLVNRIDLANKNSKILNINRPCYVPFYKMFIDCNGDVLVCNNDWSRSSFIGNVLIDTIENIWLGNNLNTYRHNLINGNRKNCNPCNRCAIDGTLLGKESAEIFRESLFS